MVQYHWPGDSDLLDKLWVVGVVSRLLGYITYGILSTEQIATGIAMATDGAVVLGSGAMFGILLAIHVTQAILCSSGTATLARVTVPDESRT